MLEFCGPKRAKSHSFKYKYIFVYYFACFATPNIDEEFRVVCYFITMGFVYHSGSFKLDFFKTFDLVQLRDIDVDCFISSNIITSYLFPLLMWFNFSTKRLYDYLQSKANSKES